MRGEYLKLKSQVEFGDPDVKFQVGTIGVLDICHLPCIYMCLYGSHINNCCQLSFNKEEGRREREGGRRKSEGCSLIIL